MKKYLLIGLLAVANIAMAKCPAVITRENANDCWNVIPGVDYDTRDRPAHLDSRKEHFEFECIDGYLYMYGAHYVTPHISTDPATGKGGFTKC